MRYTHKPRTPARCEYNDPVSANCQFPGSEFRIKKVHPSIKKLGRYRPSRELDKKASEEVASLDNHLDYVYCWTFLDKLDACERFGWGEHYKCLQRDCLTDLTQLEPILWDNFAMDLLILYHPLEKSFWAWSVDKQLPPPRRLRFVGYKWTDIFLDWPYRYFVDEMDEVW